eukprot:TRINITY_DN22909_c0_g2_i1.p1 TRINITY_DN22909_c0_g2~~TRINITY_DN22909_c0_g2_i1.p1  ORF type:complete len:550 (-),score=64.05 TRINITY_DN22909_c0_g2_i1:136-1785(-)
MASSSADKEQFCAFTGASADEAAQFLEMVGGNVEAAVQMYLDMAGGGGEQNSAAALLEDTRPKPSWWQMVWGAQGDPPASWVDQRLEFFVPPDGSKNSDYARLGLVQKANGPCGVLAALNAVLVAQCRSSPSFGPSFAPSNADLALAIATVIERPGNASKSGDAHSCQVAMWSSCEGVNDGLGHADVEFREIACGSALQQFCLEHVDAFMKPGGILLIVYSVVATRGVANVKADLAANGAEPPLITGPFSLCTSELISLLLRGTADGNVGSYGPLGGKKVDWPSDTPVGLLSFHECEHNIPVADRLKRPDIPVWILHGRDHFTFCFSAVGDYDQRELDGDVGSKALADPMRFELWHYNGLPPAGPRASRLRLATCRGMKRKAPDDAEEGVATFYTPIKGSIFDVVQARPEDKKDRPRSWKTWTYEVVLTLDDLDHTLYGQGKEYPSDKRPPVFEQGEVIPGPWRCAACYVKRHETFAFKLNDEDADTCQHCGKQRETCGWSIWKTYDELPVSWQEAMNRRYQPNITTLLDTKWPGVTIEFDDETDPPAI